ncbi:Myosin heavy chain [hydrothermal vent metagenome]|uniref:Myosin heavy chain n=1 Tax=hydrothermal vent metagenome TaxID=652676 RepID=A0A1W1D058_9ZZZZ
MSMYIRQSKEEILESFSVLLKSYKQDKKEVLTKSEEAHNKEKQALVKESAKTSVSDIVTGMASLQLNFNDVIDTLSQKLENETLRLSNLSQSIHIEEDKLAEIKEVMLISEASNLLLHEHNEAMNTLSENQKSKKEKLEKEQEETKKVWETERLALEEDITLDREREEKERSKEEEVYEYEKVRQEMLVFDTYTDEKAFLLRRMKEENLSKEKAWEKREKILDDEAKALEKYAKQVEEAPEKLKIEIAKAREKSISKITAEAKIEAQLMEKGNKANIEVFELEILSLSERAEEQKEEILLLNAQVKETVQQVQNLASNAVSHQPSH